MATRIDYRKLLINEVCDLTEQEAEKVYEAVLCLRERAVEEPNLGFATDCLAEAEMAALGAC